MILKIMIILVCACIRSSILGSFRNSRTYHCIGLYRFILCGVRSFSHGSIFRLGSRFRGEMRSFRVIFWENRILHPMSTTNADMYFLMRYISIKTLPISLICLYHETTPITNQHHHHIVTKHPVHRQHDHQIISQSRTRLLSLRIFYKSIHNI